VKLLESSDSVAQDDAAAANILRTVGGISGCDINMPVVQVRLAIGAAIEQCVDTRDIVTTNGGARSSGFPTDDAS
jgi:hypothetical protein